MKKLLLLLLASGALAAETKKTEPAKDNEAKAQVIESFKYDDKERCHVEKKAVFPTLVAAYESAKDRKLVIKALEATLKRGCDIDEIDADPFKKDSLGTGLNGLNTAIMFGNEDLVQWFLDKGANSKLPIKTKLSNFDNSLEFVNVLIQKTAKRPAKEREEKKKAYEAIKKLLEAKKK